jgi:hypothetical protein
MQACTQTAAHCHQSCIFWLVEQLATSMLYGGHAVEQKYCWLSDSSYLLPDCLLKGQGMCVCATASSVGSYIAQVPAAI